MPLLIRALFASILLASTHLLTALPGFEAFVEVRERPSRWWPAGYLYDYRSETDNRYFTVWVPLGNATVKGLFIDGNAGVSVNRLGVAEEDMRNFAQRFGFGLGATSNISGGNTYSTHYLLILDALDAFGEMGMHPELANVPFITHGNSSGGGNAYGLAMRAPDRAIAFTSNVLVGPNPVFPPESSYTIPGLFTIGETDPLVAGNRVDVPRAMAAARAADAPWAWVMIQGMGHEHRRIYRLYYPYWEAMIALRLPEDADPRAGPVTLNAIDTSTGYLMDDNSWSDPLPFVAPADDYPRDPETASWLPNENLAYLTRGYASWDNPVTFDIEGIPDFYTEKSSIIDTLSPGESLRLVANPGGIEWTRIEFFRGAVKLGEVTEGDPALDITLGYEEYAQAFTVLVHDDAGNTRTAIPQTVHVLGASDKDPVWSWLPEFGWYAYPWAPWIYHNDYGWFWAMDPALLTSKSNFIWSAETQMWYWLQPNRLPILYRVDDDTWLDLRVDDI